MSLLRTIGQISLSGIFISGGSQAFLKPGNRVSKLANAGLPEPESMVVLNGAAMVIGGTLLALDIAPKLTAAALIGSLVPTTLVGHAFWKEESEAGRKAQQTQFMKNLGLIGGLLLVLAGK
ncbi:MAG TPA: DoxX family protein [Ktedonobacteraceae bacterium]|nr:DoxX family protein [Ktedonobacteraceae bacterium]